MIINLVLDTGEPPRSRSILNGKLGMNMNMSEFSSLVMEPNANEDQNNKEGNATDGLIADIKGVNKQWRSRWAEDHAQGKEENVANQ